MKKRIAVIVLCLAAAGNIFADLTESVEVYFNDFLRRLTARHPEIESLALPEREARGEPGNDDIMRTVIILTFATNEEQEVFHAALTAEEIPLAAFPEDGRRIMLFTVDMAAFIMMDAIGL